MSRPHRRESDETAEFNYLRAAPNALRRSPSPSRSRRASRSPSRRGSRSPSRRGSFAPGDDDAELYRYLEEFSMLEHIDTLRENGFSSLSILEHTEVEDLKNIGLLTGHAIVITRALKQRPLLGPSEDSESEEEITTDLSPFIYIGERGATGEGHIYLWTYKSTVKFYIKQKHDYDYLYREKQLFVKHQVLVESAVRDAAASWNACMKGCIRFQETDKPEEATYHIRLGDLVNMKAHGQFPSDYDKTKASELTISNTMFTYLKKTNNTPDLRTILAHEFGHMLGLRHEHWDTLNENAALLVGKRNSKSIMVHGNDVGIQKSDYTNLIKVYKWTKSKVKFGFPKKTWNVHRVNPARGR